MGRSPGGGPYGVKAMRLRHVTRYYPQFPEAIPVPGVGYPRITAPFATFLQKQAPGDSFDLHA